MRADAVPANPAKAAIHHAGSDQFSTDKTALVQAALARQSEIRPEVIERGHALAADPAYPSREIIRRVSEIILRSPDLADEPV